MQITIIHNKKNFIINLDPKSSDPIFYFYFLNQTLINLIIVESIFFQIKKHKQILICHLVFYFLNSFQKLIKNIKPIKR